jgi:hypothetical protein
MLFLGPLAFRKKKGKINLIERYGKIPTIPYFGKLRHVMCTYVFILPIQIFVVRI